MIETKTLQELIDRPRLNEVKSAIVDTFSALLVGVTIKNHPGKLDVGDVLEKDVIKSPGVAVGWTRVRTHFEVDGNYGLAVEFAAYIVTETKAFLAEKKRVDRETVAYAIGEHLLAIVNDGDTHHWGLNDIAPPSTRPMPEFKPIFTANSYSKGVAYYVLNWTQIIKLEGRQLFSDTGKVGPDGLLDAQGQSADEPLPPEILAMIKGEENLT